MSLLSSPLHRLLTATLLYTAALIVLTLTGCVYEAGFQNVSCDDDQDCLDGAVCTQGFCVFDSEPALDADPSPGEVGQPGDDAGPQPDADPRDTDPDQDADSTDEGDADIEEDPCPQGEIFCDGTCVDPTTDQHCGRCNNQCENGFMCNGNDCSCPHGTHDVCDASGQCISLAQNNDHCGSCNNPCTNGTVCVDGQCHLDCGQGQEICDNQCVDLNTNNDHCGGCDSPCTNGTVCVDGQCHLDCGQGQEICDNQCVDLNTNDKFCGDCQISCSETEQCDDGLCQCAPGLNRCDQDSDTCVDLDENEAHCGQCDNVCGDQQRCISGTCTCTVQGLTACGSTCVDTQTDTNNCGGCGDENPEYNCGNNFCIDGSCNACDPNAPVFGGGTGTSTNPFLICTPEQFSRIQSRLDAYFELTSDIDLSNESANLPLGSNNQPFTGHLNGNNKKISHAKIENQNSSYQGLFAKQTGTIENLTLSNFIVLGRSRVGLLVGENTGTISNVTGQGSVTGSSQKIGGLAGLNTAGALIKDASANVDVSGSATQIGGLIGENEGRVIRSEARGTVHTTNSAATTYTGGLIGRAGPSSQIAECRATGDVTATGGLVGGFVGRSRANITDSYATGDVKGSTHIGGFAGEHRRTTSNSQRTIQRSYSSGTVEATNNSGVAGGLVGWRHSSFPGNITQSYWDEDSSKQASSAGGYGLTTAQFKDSTTFTGWDFEDNGTWFISSSTNRPALHWEK